MFIPDSGSWLRIFSIMDQGCQKSTGSGCGSSTLLFIFNKRQPWISRQENPSTGWVLEYL